MTQERAERLVRDAPELFLNYKKKNSSMYRGFACEDGWFDLLFRLLARIDRIAREKGGGVGTLKMRARTASGSPEWSVTISPGRFAKSSGRQKRRASLSARLADSPES